MTKETKDDKRTVWFSEWSVRSLKESFEAIIEGTPFEGSHLSWTGEYRPSENRRIGDCFGGSIVTKTSAYYEFELFPSVETYHPIPGYNFVGYCERVGDGDDSWTVHRLDYTFEFTKEIVDSLRADRCDVCGHKRNRKRLFVLVETEMNELVCVGGACAKKFRGVNLEVELRKLFKSTAEVLEAVAEVAEGGGGGGGRYVRDLASEIAVAEAIIEKKGYVSKREAENTNWAINSTSYWLELAYTPSTDYTEKNPDWKEINDYLNTVHESVLARWQVLVDTEFKEHKAYFEVKLENKWSEFDSNMLANLNGATGRSYGISAFLASVFVSNPVSKKRLLSEDPTTGFNGHAVGKIGDFGKFAVISIKFKSNEWGDYTCFTCINEKHEKLWFKVGAGSKAGRLWENVTDDRCAREVDGFEIEVRGKLSKVDKEISFAKNIAITKVFENGKEL